MTEVLRLTLVSHGMTDAMAAGRFPADEPLNDVGRRLLKRLDITTGARELVGPELRARQTAELLGMHATTEPSLADLDYGRWSGKRLTSIAPDETLVWLTEPDRAPHGGESISNLVERVWRWMESLADVLSPTIAVTCPAVIRAAILVALEASPKAFWRLDITPLSYTTLHWRGSAWTLRL